MGGGALPAGHLTEQRDKLRERDLFAAGRIAVSIGAGGEPILEDGTQVRQRHQQVPRWRLQIAPQPLPVGEDHPHERLHVRPEAQVGNSACEGRRGGGGRGEAGPCSESKPLTKCAGAESCWPLDE